MFVATGADDDGLRGRLVLRLEAGVVGSGILLLLIPTTSPEGGAVAAPWCRDGIIHCHLWNLKLITTH